MTSSTDLTDLGVADAVAAIRAGRTTAGELLEACLARIAATDAAIGAWTTVDGDAARTEARLRDDEGASGRETGPLHGVPVGIKDIIDVAGMPTTAGGPPFAHTRPDRDATLVARLRAAGAVIVGKTVATPFAYRDPAGTRNPWAARPHARRLVVGIGGRRRGSPRAGRDRDADDRVDPAARGVLRGRRAEGRLRRRAARRRPAARRRRSTTPGRSPGPSPTRRSWRAS